MIENTGLDQPHSQQGDRARVVRRKKLRSQAEGSSATAPPPPGIWYQSPSLPHIFVSHCHENSSVFFQIYNVDWKCFKLNISLLKPLINIFLDIDFLFCIELKISVNKFLLKFPTFADEFSDSDWSQSRRLHLLLFVFLGLWCVPIGVKNVCFIIAHKLFLSDPIFQPPTIPDPFPLSFSQILGWLVLAWWIKLCNPSVQFPCGRIMGWIHYKSYYFYWNFPINWWGGVI